MGSGLTNMNEEESVSPWKNELADICAKSLAGSVEYDDRMVKVYSLYDKLEGWVNKWRNIGDFNIRSIINNHLTSQPQDDRRKALLDFLRRRIADNEAKYDSILSDFAILTIAFSGFIAARLDSNFEGMQVMYDWCNEVSDERMRDYSICKAAECYYRFGTCRGEVSGNLQNANLPTQEDLIGILSQAEEECRRAKVQDKDRNKYIRQLRLFLMDAVMQLPPYRQDLLGKYPDLLDLSNFKTPISARVYYNLSKASYIKGGEESLDLAIKYAVDALQNASPADLNFIELCRQNLLILEQEKVARKTTKDEALKEAKTELQKTIEETIRIETRDLQMRVIEILGIFLAVTGVGVTAVGGIAVSGGFWDRLGIYVGGGLSIMILFGFLKYVVIEPIKRGKGTVSDGTKSDKKN